MQAGLLSLSVKTSCPAAIFTHVTTCQRRDHIVTVKSGDCVLVVVNVHFELDLVLRNLHERLHRIPLHWPRYPEVLAVIIGDLNICEPEEGSTSGIRPSQKVIR